MRNVQAANHQAVPKHILVETRLAASPHANGKPNPPAIK